MHEQGNGIFNLTGWTKSFQPAFMNWRFCSSLYYPSFLGWVFSSFSFEDCLTKSNLTDKSQHCTIDDYLKKNSKMSLTGKTAHDNFEIFIYDAVFLLASYWMHCTNLQYVKAGKNMNKLFLIFLQIMWLTKNLWNVSVFWILLSLEEGQREEGKITQKKDRGKEGKEGKAEQDTTSCICNLF